MQSAYAAQYEHLWRHHWWWQSRKQFVLSRIRRLHGRRPFRCILDVGCGNGLLFNDLMQLAGAPDVRGIEPDPTLVTEGPHRGRIAVRAFDAGFLPAEPLDLVLMLDVLEHIEEEGSAAGQVFRLLAPGGVFLLTVPALMALWSEHDVVNRHYRRYTKRTMRRTLEGAGFRVESLHYFFGWTIGPMLLRRLVAPAQSGFRGRVAGGPGAGQEGVARGGEGGRGGGEEGGQNGGQEEGGYRVSVPPGAVNAALYGVSRLEQMTLGRVGLPVGSSLIAVARKPG